jgi:hypothetical protein
MHDSQPDWQKYEKLVARLVADQLPTDLCVTLNARVTGGISGRCRQVDVLIIPRHNTQNSRRIIVDAKKRRRKVDITHVEALRGLMEDVGATHGYLVCPEGHTKAAERRAQDLVTICLLPLDRLEDFDPSTWPKCQRPRCTNGRVFWDGYPQISMKVQHLLRSGQDRAQVVQFFYKVGKCDLCGCFHVKCLACDELFDLRDDDGDRQCNCRLPWFWLVSIEKDEHGQKSAELHVVLGPGRIITTDRRPM